MSEPMNPNCKDIDWEDDMDKHIIALTDEEVEILRRAVPEFLRNTTMDADQELLQKAAKIIDRITKRD